MSSSLGTGRAQTSSLGIAGTSLRQGAAGTSYFEPGGVSFLGLPWWPTSPLFKADSEIFNKFVPASSTTERCTLRNHDFVSDGFLALIAACLVTLCSGLLIIAFSRSASSVFGLFQ